MQVIKDKIGLLNIKSIKGEILIYFLPVLREPNAKVGPETPDDLPERRGRVWSDQDLGRDSSTAGSLQTVKKVKFSFKQF